MKFASKTQNLLPKHEICFQNMKFASKTQNLLPKFQIWIFAAGTDLQA